MTSTAWRTSASSSKLGLTWAIVDIVGKRNKVRTVPIKPPVKVLLDEWTKAAEIVSGPIWRDFRKGSHIIDNPGDFDTGSFARGGRLRTINFRVPDCTA